MITAFLGGYLLGSIPVAIWYCRWKFDAEIQELGSGNPGATNVARVFGWASGGLVLLGDFSKGLAAVGLAMVALNADLTLAILAGFGAFMGHLFPVLARFSGGKGVATAGGTLLLLTPLALGFSILAYAVVLWISKKGSLASLSAAVVLLPSTWFSAPHMVFGYALLLVILIFITHRKNIVKLTKGEEKNLIS